MSLNTRQVKSKKKSLKNILTDDASEEFDKYSDSEKITKKDQVRKAIDYDSESEESGSESTSRSESESESESTSEDIKHSKSKSKSKDKSKSKNMTHAERNREALKNNIEVWLGCDDKIKDLNNLVKKQKLIKKEKEEIVLGMIVKLGIEKDKLDITDKNGAVKARVYRHKSVTKSPIKEDLLKETLMEIFQNERKADQIVKKLDGKRQLTERYYLKRTKGEGNKN